MEADMMNGKKPIDLIANGISAVRLDLSNSHR